MGIVVDIIIVSLIALFTIIGNRKGLVRVAIGLFSFIIALVLAFALYRPVSNVIIEKTQIDEGIKTAIVEAILPEGGTEEDEVPEESKISSVIVKSTENTVGEVSKNLAIEIIKICSLIGIFIIARVALIFVKFIAKFITNLPIIKQFDKLGGTIYGLLKGMVIVCALFVVVSFAAPWIPYGVVEAIDNSNLGSWIYNNNILLKIF